MAEWPSLLIATAHSAHLNRDTEHIPAADATAWALLSLLLFCLGCFAIGAVAIARQKRRCDLESASTKSDEPFIQQPTPSQKQDCPPQNPASWERDPDWWKQ